MILKIYSSFSSGNLYHESTMLNILTRSTKKIFSKFWKKNLNNKSSITVPKVVLLIYKLNNKQTNDQKHVYAVN